MSRFNFVLGIFFIGLLLLIPAAAYAQSLGGAGRSLTGTVFEEGTDQRIAGPTVTLCDEQGNRLAETTGNQAGEFFFRAVRPENYILRVRADGYESVELHLDMSLSSQRGLVIALKPIKLPGSTVPDHAMISAHELSMPQAARELMTSGKKKLYLEKNAQAALSDFQSATTKAPAYYEAYYQAGMAYLTLQNEAEAEKQFSKAVEISGRKYGDADIALGTLLLHRNETNDGETLLREGLGLNPQSWPGLIELGKLELSRGHNDQALAAAEKAESLAPLQPVVYRLLGLIHLREKNYAALISDLDAYIRLDPDSPAGIRAKELRAQTEKQLSGSPAQAVSVNK